MFDLERAINEWLKQFRKHRAFDHGSIREMELHLRDHIEDLIADGSSPKQAFEVAVKEFGAITPVAHEEFQNLRPKKSWRSLFRVGLFGNYCTVAIRGFSKQPFFTLLNAFGLAVGMAGGLLAALFVYDERNFDNMFADSGRIFRVNIENQTKGEYSQYATAPGPMASVLEQDCPAVEMVTRFRSVGSLLMREPKAALSVKEAHVTAVDSSFFTMFGLTLLEGNTKTALREPNSIAITKAVAQKHFGSESALGRQLLLNNKDLYQVTGIIDALPRNSFLRNHNVFLSLSSFEDAKSVAWNTWYFPTFVKLKQHTSVNDLQTFLDDVKDRYLIPWAMTFVPGLTIESSRAADKATGDFMRFNAIALTDIHLYSTDRQGEFSPNSDIENVYIMSFIGAFLLTLAAVNYMNLSTARALTRAKEVGIRKAVGGNRYGLIRQFLTESVITSLLALVLALLLALVSLPYFNHVADKGIQLPLDAPVFWMLLFCAAVLLGLLSGGYPAFFLSRFIPTEVLKGTYLKLGGGVLRSYLVVFQFAVSVFLIVSTIVVLQQVNFIQNKDLGFQKDQVLVIEDVDAAGSQAQVFKEQVNRMSRATHVSISSYLPTPSDRGGTTYFSEGALENGKFDDARAMIIEEWDIDYDYVPTLDLKIIAGRNFDRAYSTDSMGLVLNESAVAMLGVTPEKAIGTRLTSDIHRPDKQNMRYYTVIGVVKNFHFETLRNNIDAMSLRFTGKGNRMMVKLAAGNFGETIDEIEKRWHQLAPGQPFSYYFMDESFHETYRAELRLASIFMMFAVLSIFIACLGLFGLAAYNAEKRSKEIGIRKVLGASVNQIVFRLSADFLKLVAISIAVSLPLSWFAMSRWLEAFSYRINLTGWVFVLAASIAVGIAILTVSYQSIKAAVANPVRSLRSE
jgi:putative ABC transport system permease protein